MNPHRLLTDEEIRAEIGNKAERVTITGNYQHKSIGLKVGDFAQATDITWEATPEEQTQAIRKLLMDLRMMNASTERQQKEAAAHRTAYNAAQRPII